MRYSIMLRKFNLFLSLLTVIITISPLVQARGRDGHPRGQETKTKRHQFKKSKGKKHSQLTAEQRETIKSKVSQMKEAESTPKAIKQTVDQMMQNFGVEPTQRKGKGRAKRQNPLDQLTEEQKSQVDAKVKEMREAGTDRREIRKQIHSMLKGFGIEAPQKERDGKKGSRGKGKRRSTTPGQVKYQQLK